MGVVHVEVRVDECCLLEFDYFHGDDEGDGDEIVVEDDECEDVCHDQVSLGRSEGEPRARPSTNILAGSVVFRSEQDDT